jgi:hypothetical protein
LHKVITTARSTVGLKRNPCNWHGKFCSTMGRYHAFSKEQMAERLTNAVCHVRQRECVALRLLPGAPHGPDHPAFW